MEMFCFVKNCYQNHTIFVTIGSGISTFTFLPSFNTSSVKHGATKCTTPKVAYLANSLPLTFSFFCLFRLPFVYTYNKNK